MFLGVLKQRNAFRRACPRARDRNSRRPVAVGVPIVTFQSPTLHEGTLPIANGSLCLLRVIGTFTFTCQCSPANHCMIFCQPTFTRLGTDGFNDRALASPDLIYIYICIYVRGRNASQRSTIQRRRCSADRFQILAAQIQIQACSVAVVKANGIILG